MSCLWGIQPQLCTFRDPTALFEETLMEQPNPPEVTTTIPYTVIVHFHVFSYFLSIYFGGILRRVKHDKMSGI